MSNHSYRPLSLNLDPTQLGQLIQAINTTESRQDDTQSDPIFIQEDTNTIASRNSNATDTESTLSVQTIPHPEVDQKEKIRRLVHRKFWGPWGWESVAFLVAVSLAVATVVVLAKYDGEIQPKWPYNFTLGAFTALLATIIRTLLLVILEEVIGHSRWSWFQVPRPLYQLEILDQASRGPWGSLSYLARVHRLHPSTIAVLVLVLSLGINTFTQQAIRSITCIKTDPTAEAWVRTAQIIYNKDNDALLHNFDVAATQALFQGRDTTNKQSSFYCPSGNCTFTARDGITHSSLGVCSKCTDVSPKMGYVITNHTPEPMDQDLFPLTGLQPNKNFYCRWPQRNHTTEVRLGPDTQVGSFQCNISNGLIVYDSCKLDTYYTTANFSSWWTLNRDSDDWDSHISQDPTFATRFAMVTATLSGIGKYADVPPIGKACGISGQWSDGPLSNKSSQTYSVCWLYPCIKHYSGLISNGRLQETIVKSDLLSLQANHTNRADGSEYSVYGSYIDPCYIKRMRANHSQTPPLFTGDNYSSNLDCWYGFTGSFPLLFATPIIADTVFSGGLSNWDSGVPPMLGVYWMKNLINLPWYTKPNLMDPLDTISTGIDNIATVMTNAIREIGNDSYGGVSKTTGTVLHTTVCTEINWPWFSFPAAIILATLYILVHTVVDSVQDSSPVRTWKSSVLPLLYYGLEKEAQKTELETKHELSHDAKRREVCIRRDERGNWGLENNSRNTNGP